MTSLDVLKLIDVLPEAILLVSPQGDILAANAAAQDFLNLPAAELKQKNIAEFSVEPPEKIRNYLSLCSRTRQPIPGSLTLNLGPQPVPSRLSGALLSNDTGTVLWLRIVAREPANSRFYSLNQQIVNLNREIARRQRAEKLVAAQKRVLELLARDTPLKQVLTELLTSLEPLLGTDVHGSILLLDDSGTRLVHGAAPNLPSFYTKAIDGVEIGPSSGSCGTAAFLNQTVVTEDIQTDERWKDFREVASRAGLRACWSTPILGSNGNSFGTFAMYYPNPRGPSSQDLAIVEVMTRTASIAIEKARATREREQADEALRRTEKLAAAGRLAATIAHEINNPLEAVTNLLYLALNQPGISPTARDFLNMAEDELARVAHISKQTLGFYRETGAPENIDIRELLDSVLSIYSGKLNAKSITVRREYCDAPPVFAARGEMRQLFSNLIANAIDALDFNGSLTLEVCSCSLNANQRVCIRIRDNGAGIEPQDRKRLFEPFFTTKVGVGTGLGLWVSKGIVEKYKGCLQVESSTESPNRGSVFSIEFPPAPGAGRAEIVSA